jgi:competence protein ComEA
MKPNPMKTNPIEHVVRVGCALLSLTLVAATVPGLAAPPQAPDVPGVQQAERQEAKIDVNTAGSAELQTIPGIGPALAARIIAYRQEHGPFESVEQLLAVKGIGPKLLTRMRDLVVVRRPAKDGP